MWKFSTWFRHDHVSPRENDLFVSLGGTWLHYFPFTFRVLTTNIRFHSSSFSPFSGIYFNTQQAIYGCHVDIAMCLLTYTTYECAHSDLILSRFCRGYAVTQRKSQCQDIRTRQAFRYYTQRTHRASRLTSGAGGIFRNHAVRHRYVLLLVSLSIATQFAHSWEYVIREVQSCSCNHGRLP